MYSGSSKAAHLVHLLGSRTPFLMRVGRWSLPPCCEGVSSYTRSRYSLASTSSNRRIGAPSSWSTPIYGLWQHGLIKHQEKWYLSHDIQTLTQYSHTTAWNKGHLSHGIQTSTQNTHTNAWYCDIYPPIGVSLYNNDGREMTRDTTHHPWISTQGSPPSLHPYPPTSLPTQRHCAFHPRDCFPTTQ